MTFSEFAKMMHRYIFTEENVTDFLIHLVDAFMEDPFADKDCEDDKNEEYNPLCYGKIRIDKDNNSKYDSSLRKIYNGSKNLPKKKAHKIFAHADIDKFATCINDALSEIATENLKEELKKNFSEYDDKKDVGENCALLFWSILKNFSEKTPTKTTKSYNVTVDDKNNLTNNSQNVTPRFSVSAKYEICFCCINWEGNRPKSLDPDIRIIGKCIAKNNEVKAYTCKDSCNFFYPDQGAVLNYTRQDFIKSKDGRNIFLKLLNK